MSKLWAKLAPAAAKLERGSSDHDKITAADVAGAAQGLPRGPFLAGMMFLAGDESQGLLLMDELSKQTGCTHALGAAAIWDMQGGQLCGRCNGKGLLAPQVQCPACHGKRRVKPTAARLASLVGVSRATWYRRTAQVYGDVYATLEAWVNQAERHVSRGVR